MSGSNNHPNRSRFLSVKNGFPDYLTHKIECQDCKWKGLESDLNTDINESNIEFHSKCPLCGSISYRFLKEKA